MYRVAYSRMDQEYIRTSGERLTQIIKAPAVMGSDTTSA